MRTKDKIQEHQKNNDRYAEKTLKIEKETGRQIGQQQKKDTKETKETKIKYMQKRRERRKQKKKNSY